MNCWSLLIEEKGENKYEANAGHSNLVSVDGVNAAMSDSANNELIFGVFLSY